MLILIYFLHLLDFEWQDYDHALLKELDLPEFLFSNALSKCKLTLTKRERKGVWKEKWGWREVLIIAILEVSFEWLGEHTHMADEGTRRLTRP